MQSLSLTQLKSKPRKTLSALSLVDVEILQAVWFHHFMTAEQVLQHRERSINGLPKMQEKLKWLYEQHFQTTSVVICFVTPTGDKRREQMKLWCEEQLVGRPVYRTTQQSGNNLDDASLFLFGSVPSGGLCPTDVFCSPLWYAPFDKQPQTLLVI